MKAWYVDVKINYTDKNELPVYYGTEIYTFIITEKTQKLAESNAKKQAIKQFNDEINEDFEDIKVEIADIYETSDDARCS